MGHMWPLLYLSRSAAFALATSLKLVIRDGDSKQSSVPANVRTSTFHFLHFFSLPSLARSHIAHPTKMPSVLVNSTIQACLLTATSNFIAQFITAYKTNVRLLLLCLSYESLTHVVAIHNKLDTGPPVRPLHSPQYPAKLPLVSSSEPNLILLPHLTTSRQSFLESAFPSSYLVPSTSAIRAASSSDEKELDREEKTHEILESKLSIRNTLTKFALDQSIGASVNTVLFSLVFAGFNGAGYAEAVQIAGEEFWPLMTAGWKLWPMVSLINYALVKSIEGRTLVGSLAGMGWGVYMSLMRS